MKACAPVPNSVDSVAAEAGSEGDEASRARATSRRASITTKRRRRLVRAVRTSDERRVEIVLTARQEVGAFLRGVCAQHGQQEKGRRTGANPP